MPYDTHNIFAKILRGEIPCQKIYEDDFSLAFKDIHPQAPIHILVIPKGAYCDYQDFTSQAHNDEIAGFHKAVAAVAHLAGAETSGYRLISNSGVNAHQEVAHYHVHILGGHPLGPLLTKK